MHTNIFSRIPDHVPDKIRLLCYHKELDRNLLNHIEEKTPFPTLPQFGVPSLSTTWVRRPKLLELLGQTPLEQEEQLQEEQQQQEGAAQLEARSRSKKIQLVSKILPLDLFKCLACTEQVHLYATFQALELHFLDCHGVQELLSSSVVCAVRLPRSLARFTCTLCHEGGWLVEQEMKGHLDTRHGPYFRDQWLDFCVFHCR